MAMSRFQLVSMALFVLFTTILLTAARQAVGQAAASPPAGFLSIDCGLEANYSGYKDSKTGIVYVSDEPYIDSGENHRIANEKSSTKTTDLLTLRSFPSGLRNCYTLPTHSGSKYLIRLSFVYGNYDGKDSSSTLKFDLQLGPYPWVTVDKPSDQVYEAVFVAWARWTPVCLVNVGAGTPFVSTVELRLLDDALYPAVMGNQSMSLYTRRKMGNSSDITRYPDDTYDRYWWQMWYFDPLWKNISTVSNIKQSSSFAVPSLVMQTAIVAVDNKTVLNITWEDKTPSGHDLKLFLHFADFQNSQLRQFNTSLNDGEPYQYSPPYLTADALYNVGWLSATDGKYSISLVPTAASKLPPMINALEVYSLISHDSPTTFPVDYETIMAIKLEYGIKKNWMGDPLRDEGSFDSDANMCNKPVIVLSPAGKNARATTIAISVVVPVIAIVVLVLVLFIWKQKRKHNPSTKEPPRVQPELPSAPEIRKQHEGVLQKVENRQFTYNELEKFTNKFERPIGRGGFGPVYYGRLEDNTEVAVKMRSESSSHGLDEFFAEVQSLTKVHHRNLVSLVGYCWEMDHLALVYEYMAQGNLCDHLRGLDYLHKGCSPPIIHRDVKTANILLGQNLQAKIADFGLSKTYHSDTQTHISVTAAGTAGRLTESSDVYSFGIVLLEIATGESPIIPGQGHIVQRVKKKIATGNISLIADTRLGGSYEVSSMWKVVDTALLCTADVGTQRPTMAAVVVQLKESMALEEAYADSGFKGSTSTLSDTTTSMSTYGPTAR
uniref:Protein kinase domain-containing protein n=1 Tax=Leersia perrieri TaxID=77586 RepID=A0A0D9XCS1_9ORYZ